MFLVMRDTAETRIKVDAVTSYARDREVNHMAKSTWPTIRMTIGSVLIVLAYGDLKDRDGDIELLDSSVRETK